MLMWIILGSLITLVIGFLVVTSVLDRKKQNKLKIEEDKLKIDIRISGSEIVKKIKKVISENNEELEKFVVSVGNKKMSDINNKAKEDLIKIRDSKNFKLIKHVEEDYKVFAKNINDLISEKSNNWEKRCKENIDFFINYKNAETKPMIKKKGKK